MRLDACVCFRASAYLTPTTSMPISWALSINRRAVFKSAPNFIENRQIALESSVTMRKTSLERIAHTNDSSVYDDAK